MKCEMKSNKIRGLISAMGMTLMGAAILKELRKPKTERAWHGQLWGRVPYEFRPPTVRRLRQAYWAPEDKHVFTDTPFGVGWSVNLGQLAHACFAGLTKMRACKGPASTTAPA
jgi:Family of unknown function (DUF5808)